MYLEIARSIHKISKFWFCLFTFGLRSYDEFGKKYVTEHEATTGTVEKKKLKVIYKRNCWKRNNGLRNIRKKKRKLGNHLTEVILKEI